MIIKALVAIILTLPLAAGCTTTKSVVLDQSRVVVITVPKNLLDCPQIGKLPNPETLTNKQVAQVIEKLYRYNRTCGINMQQIQDYIEKAKKVHG